EFFSSGFKTAPLPVSAAIRNVLSVKSPGDLKLRDVRTIDLGQGRVAHAARVVSIERPVIHLSGRGADDCQAHQAESRDPAHLGRSKVCFDLHATILHRRATLASLSSNGFMKLRRD